MNRLVKTLVASLVITNVAFLFDRDAAHSSYVHGAPSIAGMVVFVGGMVADICLLVCAWVWFANAMDRAENRIKEAWNDR